MNARQIMAALGLAAAALCGGAASAAPLPNAPDGPAAEKPWVDNLPYRKVDEAKVAAAGIRKLKGKWLTLYTDMKPDPEIEILPQVFDEAVPQIAAYFGLSVDSLSDWHVTGSLIQDKSKFRKVGLQPGDLPEFLHAFCRYHELWVYEQPSAYYRRHLLIHEGVHALMATRLGSCGPPWYMEGMAELLATHRWKDGKLTLRYMPATRDEAPQWGRVLILKEAMAAKQGKRLEGVIEIPAAEYLKTECYAWAWGLATLLDKHPRYQERFRSLGAIVRSGDFTERFRRLYAKDWPELCEEWQLFAANIEYGYDVARAAVAYAPGRPIAGGEATASIRADRGWQSTGIRLEKGENYAISAAGRYYLAEKSSPWVCEPNGVSIRYYQGRPLGILLGAVRPDTIDPERLSPLVRPAVVGLGTSLAPAVTGTLYLKINESAADLGDNSGELSVSVRRKAE